MTSTETSNVVELRRYALRPGARDTLIGLFDREFVEPQEALGMRLLGQFRDLDDPDSFVWLRGFTDMESRRQALEDFYSGPTWKRHAAAANATMVDVDNVLLLRPFGERMDLEGARRVDPGSIAPGIGLLAATICHLAPDAGVAFADHFREDVRPRLEAAGLPPLATYTSERSPNTFPALPVRADADVFVILTMHASEAAHAACAAELSAALNGAGGAVDRSRRWLARPPEELRLTPTARSLLHA